MTSRKEQAALAKGRLIQAAKHLIAQEGYDKVTIADITHACDMSVGNFYHYFKTKGELIIAIERDPYTHAMDELIQGGGSTLEQLTAYVQKWNDLGEKSFGRDFNRQWFIYHVSNPLPADDPQNKATLAVHELSQCLYKGVDSGELKSDTPVELLAREISFSIFGSDFASAITSTGFDRQKWCEEYCAQILPMLLTPYFKEK